MKHIRLAVVLTAGWQIKEWPVENYARVCQALAERMPLEPIVLGAGERAARYAEKFCRLVPEVRNLVGQTTLREMAAVLARCDAYLGGDTGPLHLAAAEKIPGVALFVNRTDWREDGLNTSNRFGPWHGRIVTLAPEYPLSGCEHGCVSPVAHCIQQIHPRQVTEVLAQQLRIGA